jgi:hypothetical protein
LALPQEAQGTAFLLECLVTPQSAAAFLLDAAMAASAGISDFAQCRTLILRLAASHRLRRSHQDAVRNDITLRYFVTKELSAEHGKVFTSRNP